MRDSLSWKWDESYSVHVPNLYLALRHVDNGCPCPEWTRSNSAQTLGGRVYPTKGPATAMRNRWRKQGFEADSYHLVCKTGQGHLVWHKLS
jgi:hypothetical protein